MGAGRRVDVLEASFGDGRPSENASGRSLGVVVSGGVVVVKVVFEEFVSSFAGAL